MAEHKPVKLVDRWAKDSGVAFFDADGKEIRLTDNAPEEKKAKKGKNIEEIEEL